MRCAFVKNDVNFLENLIYSKVPAYLNVVDIAGLVKGAAEGQGLGNAFLSHISACDAIFHLCRQLLFFALFLLLSRLGRILKIRMSLNCRCIRRSRCNTCRR